MVKLDAALLVRAPSLNAVWLCAQRMGRWLWRLVLLVSSASASHTKGMLRASLRHHRSGPTVSCPTSPPSHIAISLGSRQREGLRPKTSYILFLFNFIVSFRLESEYNVSFYSYFCLFRNATKSLVCTWPCMSTLVCMHGDPEPQHQNQLVFFPPIVVPYNTHKIVLTHTHTRRYGSLLVNTTGAFMLLDASGQVLALSGDPVHDTTGIGSISYEVANMSVRVSHPHHHVHGWSLSPANEILPVFVSSSHFPRAPLGIQPTTTCVCPLACQ